jgi:hypothetical protein
VEWLRNECVVLQLSRETYANAHFLVDSYFKTQRFNSSEFLRIALCSLIIASKINESKILYTRNIAQNNGIEEQKMIEKEIMLLSWCKFRADPYNFARIVGEYVWRWDELVKATEANLPLFL